MSMWHTVAMSRKSFIWGGMFVGSSVGGLLPSFWGSSMISMSAVVLTAVGGVVGIWGGLKLASWLGI